MCAFYSPGQVDDASTIKNSDIAKELSLPPVKLHCSSESYWSKIIFFILVQLILIKSVCVCVCSLVPRAIPSFSMLHAEKWEGLVRKITCVTCPVERQ